MSLTWQLFIVLCYLCDDMHGVNVVLQRNNVGIIGDLKRIIGNLKRIIGCLLEHKRIAGNISSI